MIPIVILVVLTVIIITTLIFTNEKWTNYYNHNTLKNTDTYATYEKHNHNTHYYRKEYRLPYRYPVGFAYEGPEPHISTIHAYDINT